ncbi:E3 ubiquitin-protein ligase TRAIP [Anopheles cruzii]|uniref:E3 ubiquitin-protein ligase TRAIP n=1 Tax=Anopheles cruzii TaxID=68878 RepID=UPI0022EC9844|nr:E3 ubiquitin-protein ligase TRAIP [Anopheles cruzii]
MNLLCAICSDLFVPSDDVHSTTCGHMFHYVCLLQWLQRSKTCPQCRNRCIESKLVKVYFNVAANASGEDGTQLLVKLDNLTLKLHETEKNLKDQQKRSGEHKDEQKKMRKTLLGLEEQLRSKESALSLYKHEIDMLRGDRHCMLKMKEELDMLKPRLESYATIQQALKATVQEVDQMLASDTSRATVIALAATLKRELQAQEIRRKEQSDRLHRLQNELMEERRKRKTLEENLSSCDSEIYRLEQQVKQLSAKAEHHNVSVESASPEASVIVNTPDQQPPVRRKRPMMEEDLNSSTPLSEKVRKIVNSTSPYLRIKTSNLGLAPLMRSGLSSKPMSSCNSKDVRATSKVPATSIATASSSKFSLLAHQRPSSSIKGGSSLLSLGSSNNSEPDSEPENKPRFILTSSTVTARLKTGKLKRHPSTILNGEKLTGENALDIIADLDIANIVGK